MANRLLPPGYQIFDANGDPVPGALCYTYEAGTSTPKITYSDGGGTIPNANPIVADSAGRFGNIFAEEGDYRLVMETAAGVVIFTADPVEGAGAAATMPGSGLRNVIINGGFTVNQRSVTSAADDTYCLDRWYVLAQLGSADVALQSLQSNGIPNNIRLTQPDASAKRIGVAQIVESGSCYYLRGATVALSAQVRSSLAASIHYAILSWTGSADTVTSDVVLDWTSTSYTAGGFFLASNVTVQAVGTVTPSAAVWTPIPEITATLTGSLNNVVVMFWTTDATAQSATLDISNVQLEQGDEATAFEYLSPAMTLNACMRYYCTMETSLRFDASGVAALSGGYSFAPPMRVAPTMARTDTVALRDNVDAAYPTAFAVTAVGWCATIVSAGIGDSNDIGRVWTADAEL
jgi:hypothetical protein